MLTQLCGFAPTQYTCVLCGKVSDDATTLCIPVRVEEVK